MKQSSRAEAYLGLAVCCVFDLFRYLGGHIRALQLVQTDLGQVFCEPAGSEMNIDCKT